MIKIKSGFTGERICIIPTSMHAQAQKDPFLANLHLTDVGFYPHAMHHFRERTDPIDQYILIYCVDGSGAYRVGKKEYVVRANQFFVIPPHTPHAYWSNNDDPWTIYWVHIRGHMCDEIFDGDYSTPHDVTPAGNSRITSRNVIFEELFQTISDNCSIDNMRYCTSLLYGYLATFRYLDHFRRYRDPSDAATDSSDTIAMAIKFMQESIEKQLTLEDISRYIGYSIPHFSSIFKKYTGDSPLSYFNRLKIQYASQLLSTTRLRINQISAQVGIDDSYYFTRLFTKIVGMSPKKYRESLRTLVPGTESQE